jgi:hypothetical protein
MRAAVALAFVGLLLAGCSHPAKPTNDERFIAQATYILGSRPDDPARMIASIKTFCQNSDYALATTTATQPPGAARDLVRAGLVIYCPDKVAVFDGATTAH